MRDSDYPTSQPQNIASPNYEFESNKFINRFEFEKENLFTVEGKFSIQTWPPKSPVKNSESNKIVCTHNGCNRLFRNRESLRRHGLVHRPKTFKCEYCEKSFVENSKLKRHYLVHTGLKPFRCYFPGCQKQFSLSYNLKYV